MRTNIYFRVFRKTKQNEPQREKWADVRHEIRWNKSELIDLINRRLAEVFREQYTTSAPTIRDILPQAKKKSREEAINFILDRTFMRPRDLIAFLNICIEHDSHLNLTWARLEQAEGEYSKKRLDSVIDEWKDSFFGLPALFPLLSAKGSKFHLQDITDNEVYGIISSDICNECIWLSGLQSEYLNDSITLGQVKAELIQALYLVGIIGIRKDGSGEHVIYSFDRPLDITGLNLTQLNDSAFQIHKMFWRALGLSDNNPRA